MLHVRSTLRLLTALLVLHIPAAIADASRGPEAELRKTIQALLDAIGHAEVCDKYVHDRLVRVDEGGVVRDKAVLLKELMPLPKIGRIAIDTFRLEAHGGVAVVAHEIQEHLDYHGQILRSRFRVSDTWLKVPDGWKLIAEKISAMLKDPPVVRLSHEHLCGYSGSYRLTDAITTTIRCTDTELIAERTGRPPVKYVAELPDFFFVPGQPRTRRIFLRNEKGAVVGFADRREGEDVWWKKDSNAAVQPVR